MQESELETPGLEDSQDWVNVPQDQATEVEITTATVETTQGDEVAVEQNVTVVHPSEVSLTTPWSRVCDKDSPCRTCPYLRQRTLTGQRTKKEGSRLSPGYKPNLGRPSPLPPRTGHNPFLTRIRQMTRMQMVTYQPTMTALRKLAGDVAVHVVIVGLAVGEVAVGIVVLIVVAIVVVSAGASGGTGVALGAARGAVSEPSLQCQTAVQCGSLLQVTVDVVMAIGGVMNGAVVAAAGAGLAVGDNRF
jgi:hypothetical protein